MKTINLSNDIIDKVSKHEKSCIGCNLCMKECPMSSEVILNPKDIMKSINSSGGIDPSIPYSCTFCNSCIQKCPKEIDLSSMYNEIRSDILKKDEKAVKSFGYNTIKFHQKSSFSKLFTGSFIPSNCTTVFFPGCSLSGYSSSIVSGTFDFLTGKIENLGLLITCCGKPSLDIGDKKSFNNDFKSVLHTLESNGIKKVIVACSNCYNTVKKYGSVEVISLWEVLHSLGVPSKVKGIYKGSSFDVTLHDPCPIRNESQIHESIRSILNEIGLEFKEFEKNKEKTQCCGAGGMMMSTNRNVALKQMKHRAESTDSSHIISYCESCVQSMITGGKKSLHILDFLFNENIIQKSTNTQESKGLLSHWKERRKTRNITLKHKK